MFCLPKTAWPPTWNGSRSLRTRLASGLRFTGARWKAENLEQVGAVGDGGTSERTVDTLKTRPGARAARRRR